MKSRFYLIFLAFFLIFSQNIAVKSENFNQNPEVVFAECSYLETSSMEIVKFESKWTNIPPELGDPSFFDGFIEIIEINDNSIRKYSIPLYFYHVSDNIDGIETYYWRGYFELPKGKYNSKLNGAIQGREFSNSVDLKQCNFILFPITMNN